MNSLRNGPAALNAPAPAALVLPGARNQNLGTLPAIPAFRHFILSSQRQRWELASAIPLLGICGFLWHRRYWPFNSMLSKMPEMEQSACPSSSGAETLKKELFQLEVDHVYGIISVKEYAAAKKVLDEAIDAGILKKSHTKKTLPASYE